MNEIRLVHDYYDQAHLDAVIADMQLLGAPTIRVIDCGDYYQAIEGCHRLRACKELKIEPVVEVVKYDEDTLLSDFDADDQEDILICELLEKLAAMPPQTQFSEGDFIEE